MSRRRRMEKPTVKLDRVPTMPEMTSRYFGALDRFDRDMAELRAAELRGDYGPEAQRLAEEREHEGKTDAS